MHGVNSRCQDYINIYWEWVYAEGKQAREDWYNILTSHRRTCPHCRAETTELTRAAEQAQMPEMEAT